VSGRTLFVIQELLAAPSDPSNTPAEAAQYLAAALLFGVRPTDRALIGWGGCEDPEQLRSLEQVAQYPIREAGDA
jgi:hypothetical protein